MEYHAEKRLYLNGHYMHLCMHCLGGSACRMTSKVSGYGNYSTFHIIAIYLHITSLTICVPLEYEYEPNDPGH